MLKLHIDVAVGAQEQGHRAEDVADDDWLDECAADASFRRRTIGGERKRFVGVEREILAPLACGG